MKKLFALLFISTLLLLSLFSQVAVDVFDSFYDDLTSWENTGLINYAPHMRPLPLQEIKRILELVMEIGNERERDLATEHYKRIFKRAFHFGASAELGFAISKNEKNNRFIDMSPIMDLNYILAKYLAISANVKLHLTNRLGSEEPLPKFRFSHRDLVDDNANVGKLKILPAINSGITIGNQNYYFSANLARVNYGPFYDSGIFVSKEAKYQGQFNFVINKGIISYDQSLLVIAASDDAGANISPNKFLSTHAIHFRPLSWLSFGLRDSMIFGGRFEPTYLIPLSVFHIAQGLFNFPDNALIGADFSIKPIDGLRLDGAVYADDMGFNDIIKFKKDVKARIAGQFGVSYTMPKKHWFKSVAMDYTFVMPYTYTHITGDTGSTVDSGDPNYENYTHYGQNLGTALNPNSDRIKLKLQFEPLSNFRISLSNTFIRHGNVNESVSDPRFLLKYMTENYNTSGTVFNHASVKSPDKNNYAQRLDLFQHANPFMKQKTIEYINQLALDIQLQLPIIRSGGYMKFFLGYCFEADINPGVNTRMFKPSKKSAAWKGAVLSEVANGSFTVPAGTIATSEVIEEANHQKAEWRKRAVGKKFTHYIKLGASFSY